MKKLISDVLDQDQVDAILELRKNFSGPTYGPWVSELEPVLTEIEKHLDIDFSTGYWNIEQSIKGHKWHYDGCTLEFEPNHMAWCTHSAVMLLTPPDSFKDGEFRYVDKDSSKENPKIHRDDLYKSLLLYSSGADNDPLLHMATPGTDGKRITLLIFLKAKEKENANGRKEKV